MVETPRRRATVWVGIDTLIANFLVQHVDLYRTLIDRFGNTRIAELPGTAMRPACA